MSDIDAILNRPVRTVVSKQEKAAYAMENPRMIIRERNRRSLFRFIQFFWSEYSADKFVPNWHIIMLCEQLQNIAIDVAEGRTRKHDLLVNIPPGTSKTAITSIFFPLWCWTNWHWMRFITASYSEALALESAEFSRDIMRSALFRHIYPEIEIKADKDTKGNFRCVKKVFEGNRKAPTKQSGGNRFSTSVGGTLTGFHGHILIVDDPLDPNRALSEKEMTRANHWVSQTLSTRKADKRTAVTIMIMQRLHQNDPAGAWLSNPKKRIHHICLPGEIKNYADQVKPPELKKYYTDGLLDAVRMPWSVIHDLLADLGQYGFAGQIGQVPTPPGGGMFKVDQFQIIDSIDPKLIESTVRYWDKAGTQGDGAYTAGVKMCRLRGGKFLVMDVRRGQWSTDNRERTIRATAEADTNRVDIWIEQEPGSGGKESAEATIQRLVGFHVEKERPQGDKIFRADPFSVQVNEGNVWLLRGEWNHEYIDEFKFFPFSTYKDQVDASSGAFTKLISKKSVRSW